MVWDVAAERARFELAAFLFDAPFSPDGARIAGFSTSDPASRLAAPRVLHVYATRDGAEQRAWPRDDDDEFVGWAGAEELLVHGPARIGVRRVSAGASLTAHLLDDDPAVVWALGSGHFDAPPAALAHLRIFAPAAYGEAFPFRDEPSFQRFERPDLRLDFFR